MKLLTVGLFTASLLLNTGDDGCTDQPIANSGVTKATTQIATGPDGLTVEQRNVRDRLQMDNKPGSIKHLYVISAFSGQVILYSTVKGKVTSSGKRLTPTSASTYQSSGSFKIELPGDSFYTNEVLQDDGTYGSSVEYLYWWDVQGRYHQHYVSGGQIVHISDQPIPVKSITINMEAHSEQ